MQTEVGRGVGVIDFLVGVGVRGVGEFGEHVAKVGSEGEDDGVAGGGVGGDGVFHFEGDGVVVVGGEEEGDFGVGEHASEI